MRIVTETAADSGIEDVTGMINMPVIGLSIVTGIMGPPKAPFGAAPEMMQLQMSRSPAVQLGHSTAVVGRMRAGPRQMALMNLIGVPIPSAM